jgi:hypothetical protein
LERTELFLLVALIGEKTLNKPFGVVQLRTYRLLSKKKSIAGRRVVFDHCEIADL